VLVVAATERELAHVRGLETFVCGIGPVEAAARTAARLAEEKPDAVLHVGIAGARELEPLSIVLGTEAVYCDIRARVPLTDSASPDPALLARLQAALPDAHLLPIGTSAAVGGGASCDVEAMEGFGVLRACALAGVPAVELRVISNRYDEAAWRFEEAFELLGATLGRLDVV
jgi:predicted 5'-methylthioadenosine/S-adenosylhomocysteine nucleosidase